MFGVGGALDSEGGAVMARCPVCQSLRVVVVIAPTRRAFCTTCGARWVQEGSIQRAVERFWLGMPGLQPTMGGDQSA